MPAPNDGVPAAPSAPDDTADLLAAARGGDRAAYDQVFGRVYDELRRVASRQAARFGRDATLSTTALVHEAYLKLAGNRVVPVNDRVHFFALAASAMRQILINHARHGGRKKRGGDCARVGLEPAALDALAAPSEAPVDDLLALDRALERLDKVDTELAQMVEWRFFAGLTLEEISELTGVSERTLKRDWQVARAFLLRDLAGEGAQT
ncbi:MAG: hypothetical protein AMXMBFR36_08220 [Acidobacteriota bacterium]